MSSPISAPRRDVVTHSRSPVGALESRAITRSGVPMRSSRAASTWAEVGTAALLGALGQDHAAGVAAAGGADGLQGHEGGGQGVPVVGEAPAVEAVALEGGRPRSATVAPSRERGLLVVVAVDEHGARGPRVGRRHVDEDRRGQARDAHHLDGGAREVAGRAQAAISSAARSSSPRVSHSGS